MSRKDPDRAPTIPAFEGPARPDSPTANNESGTVHKHDEQRRKIRHDLRSPLNQIIGFSEMLREDAEEQGLSNFTADLQKIELAARRMVTLIDEFADAHTQHSPSSTHSVPILSSLPPLISGSTSRRPLLVRNSEPEGVTSKAQQRISKQEGRKGRILAVDDDPMNREMVARRLSSLGYQVATASGGRDALQQLERESFDLVLLDVIMPEVSGLQVLETLRAQYDRGDLPVIMTTALDGSSDVVEALRLGANDYVTKPLDMAIVVARIDTQLDLRQARDKVRELNLRLEAVQSRVASLADHSEGEGFDPNDWARSIASEIGEAIGHVEVAVWLFDGERLDTFNDASIPQPAADELLQLRQSGRLYREREALLSISGPSGRQLGVIGVAIGRHAFGEAEEHLVQNFSRHLGSVLELGEMRKELARTAQQRRASEQQLIERGVDVLHLCPACNRCYAHDTARCPVDGSSVHTTARPTPFRVRQRYRLQRLVGEGGMGTVFRAHDERLDREVAIKLIKADLFHNDTVRLRFEQEARAVARIDHPSVIAIYDFGEAEEGSLYMVMEWLHGLDLGKILEAQGPGSPRQVASMLRQAASALGAAHRAKLVHRDIKPDNIFIDAQGDELRAKVLDFGVAKEMSGDMHLTQTGSLVGTPLYMSPEQVLNGRVDARSDIYSLAAVAFESLTGDRTVKGEQFAEVVLSVAGDIPPPLSSKLPAASSDLDEAFARGLAKNAADRPLSIEAWVDSVAPLLDTLPDGNHWLL